MDSHRCLNLPCDVFSDLQFSAANGFPDNKLVSIGSDMSAEEDRAVATGRRGTEELGVAWAPPITSATTASA